VPLFPRTNSDCQYSKRKLLSNPFTPRYIPRKGTSQIASAGPSAFATVLPAQLANKIRSPVRRFPRSIVSETALSGNVDDACSSSFPAFRRAHFSSANSILYFIAKRLQILASEVWKNPVNIVERRKLFDSVTERMRTSQPVKGI
jgi:hypothetical protein